MKTQPRYHSPQSFSVTCTVRFIPVYLPLQFAPNCLPNSLPLFPVPGFSCGLFQWRFYEFILNARTCRTRTATGTRLASCATSAAFLWSTSSSVPRLKRSTAAPATTQCSQPAATDATRSSVLVSVDSHYYYYYYY